MGRAKKEASRKVREGKSSDGMANVKVKGENFYRYVGYSVQDAVIPSSMKLL